MQTRSFTPISPPAQPAAGSQPGGVLQPAMGAGTQNAGAQNAGAQNGGIQNGGAQSTAAPVTDAPTVVVGTPSTSAAHQNAMASLGAAIHSANSGVGAPPPPAILPNGWNYDTGEFLGEGIREEDLPERPPAATAKSAPPVVPKPTRQQRPGPVQALRQSVTSTANTVRRARARRLARIEAKTAPQKPFYRPGQRPAPAAPPPRALYPDEIKFAPVYAHYDAYDRWRAGKKDKARKRRQAMLTALLVGASLLLTTGAAAGSDTAAPLGADLSMADFNIYQSGQQLLEIDDALHGAFWYSFAESYNLDPSLLETARGVQIGQRDGEALAAYGHLTAWVEYSTGHSTNYLPATNYQTWADSAQYTADYLVTFRAFTINGKMETDEEKVANLYASPANSKQLREYGVSLLVQNGVVADIECYTHELKAS